MAGKDIVVMSIGEVRRLKVVQTAIDRHVTQIAAASMLELSERQVRRLVKVVREQGDKGVIHKLRGHPSNRRFPEEVRRRVLSLYQERYPDFGPTLATEKLLECDGIKISDETLRTWLIEGGV
jgi:transposase